MRAAVLGLGPWGSALQAAKAAGAARVIAIDTVEERLALARSFGAEAVHLTGDDPRSAVKAATAGRAEPSTRWATPTHSSSACRVTRKAARRGDRRLRRAHPGPHGDRLDQGPDSQDGHANVIGHVDRVLAMLDSGVLDPRPIVTHHMKLEDAAEAYAVYDRREALKIVMKP